MKKIAFAMASILIATTGGAFADEVATALTTKGYVDAGLKYVYDRAKTADDKADTINNIVGATENDGLRKQVADLSSTIQNLEDSDTTYTAGDGITIDANDNNKISLDVDATEGNMYVYTSGGWSELPVENTWNPSIFTTPDNGNGN